MRASCRNLKTADDPYGLRRLDNCDLRRVSDVHEKGIRRSVVNCPTRASGHGKVRDRGFLLHVHYRDCEGAWDCWIADICSKQEIAAWIMSQTIGPDAHFHLDDTRFVFRREKAHSVLATIRGEDEIMLFR